MKGVSLLVLALPTFLAGALSFLSPCTLSILMFAADHRPIVTTNSDVQSGHANKKRDERQPALIQLHDRQSRRFLDLGLRAARLSDDRWLEKLVEQPLMLRMPLVRDGSQLTVGDATQIWQGWTGR